MRGGETGCAIGEFSKSLGTTHAIDFVRATQIGGNQRRGIDFTLRARRGANDDTGNPGNAGGCCQHIHDRGKSPFAARDVESYAANGRDLLSGDDARSNLCKPLLVRQLALVEGADIVYSVFESCAHRRITLAMSLLDLSTAYAQLF